MKFPYRLLTILAMYFFLTISASAAVVISEIMYDLDGADTDREWVEILNNGSESIDLTGWKFDDGATSKHGLNAPPKNGGQGSLIIPAGSYAILAQNAVVFLSEYQNYTGTVIDTLVELSNTSDTASLVDGSGGVVDTVTYDSVWGAKDDGNSLQKIVGVWKSAFPTPGASNDSSTSASTGDTAFQQETSATSTGSTSTANTSNNSSFPVEPQIFASAGEKKRTVTVGGTTTFSGRAWGLKKEPIENARMLWNFGDGSIAEGKTVAHTYRYPGTYIVTLDASSGYYSASDRVTIEAVSADIVISSVGDSQSSFVELYNKSRYELDLSFWSIRAGNLTFIIPEHTFVVAGAKIKFASEVTGLPAAMGTAQVGITSNTLANVALYYPNGTSAHSYSPATSRTASPSPTNTTQPVIAKKTAEKQPLSGQENIKNAVISQGTITEKEPTRENTQAASVGNLPEQNSQSSTYPGTSSLFWWIMGVCAFAAVGIASAFFTKHDPSLELAKNEADSYEIIEETEDDKIPF